MSKYNAWKELERQTKRRLEREGFEAKRCWNEQFEEGGGVDIRAKKRDISLAIQCKYGQKPNFKEAWIEANTAKKKNEIPLGIIRLKKEKNTLVILSLKDFLTILGK